MNNGKIKVAFFDTKPYDRKFFDEENLNFGFDITYFESRLTPESAGLAAGYCVVCAFVNDNLDKKTIDTLVAGGVKLLAMRCAGYNNVNLAAAHDRLPVVRVPEYSPYAVAEYTLGLLLCLNRKLHRAFCRVRENNFSINGFIGFDLHGKTIGIVGTGKIGRTFAQILQGFGVRILASDPYPDYDAARELKIKYVQLNELFRHSDIISLHCPLTDLNHHLLNAKTFAQMKPGVVILNTSRGKLIDSVALVKALKSGRVGGAGLDVYEEETDYFFEDRSEAAIPDDVLARLLSFPNVLVTSHQAFFTREAMSNIALTTLQNIADFANGRELKNAVCYHCDGTRNCPGKVPFTRCHPAALEDKAAPAAEKKG